MKFLTIALALFAFIETLNVIILYFAPGSNKGNGMGAFRAYEKAKEDPEVFALVRYLVNWVAGTKLIFIALLVVILVTGTNEAKILAAAGLVVTIATFYWRLYPEIRRMDKREQVIPKGYSGTLGVMIAVFIAVFLCALAIVLVTG